MNTLSKRPLISLVLATVAAGLMMAVSSTADARGYYRYYGPFHHSYGYYGRARVPVYNFNDAHRLSRQTVGVGD